MLISRENAAIVNFDKEDLETLKAAGTRVADLAVSQASSVKKYCETNQICMSRPSEHDEVGCGMITEIGGSISEATVYFTCYKNKCGSPSGPYSAALALEQSVNSTVVLPNRLVARTA